MCNFYITVWNLYVFDLNGCSTWTVLMENFFVMRWIAAFVCILLGYKL